MIIDAHHHFWDRANPFTQWPPDGLSPIDRDFLPHDLAPVVEAAGLAGTVLVQAASSPGETEWLIARAMEAGWVRGVVGWADLAAPDAPDVLALLAARPKLRGIRPMLQDMAQRDWILRPEVEAGLRAAAEHGLVFDALVRADQLPVVTRLAQRHPDLRIVLDHCGKPDIASNDLAQWCSDIAALAQCPNVWCKLSGLWTEAGGAIDDGVIGPVVDHVLASFGSRRVLWGSDWPVLHLAGDVPGWLAQCQRLLASLGDAQRERIFSGNAVEVYRLDQS